jgi:hypothetical protein
MPINPALGRLRQEDHEFEATSNCPKKINKQTQKNFEKNSPYFQNREKVSRYTLVTSFLK